MTWAPPWVKQKAQQSVPPTDILDKWKNDELPPEVLQAAQVPSYEEWSFRVAPPQEPGWGVRPQGYKPRQVSMRAATGTETPAEFAPYQPDITGELPRDVYSSFAKIPSYHHPYETGVAKPITAGVLERYPEPETTPETPAYQEGLRGAGLYGLPSQAKQGRIRQMGATEVPSLPLYA